MYHMYIIHSNGSPAVLLQLFGWLQPARHRPPNPADCTSLLLQELFRLEQESEPPARPLLVGPPEFVVPFLWAWRGARPPRKQSWSESWSFWNPRTQGVGAWPFEDTAARDFGRIFGTSHCSIAECHNHCSFVKKAIPLDLNLLQCCDSQDGNKQQCHKNS